MIWNSHHTLPLQTLAGQDSQAWVSGVVDPVFLAEQKSARVTGSRARFPAPPNTGLVKLLMGQNRPTLWVWPGGQGAKWISGTKMKPGKVQRQQVDRSYPNSLGIETKAISSQTLPFVVFFVSLENHCSLSRFHFYHNEWSVDGYGFNSKEILGRGKQVPSASMGPVAFKDLGSHAF